VSLNPTDRDASENLWHTYLSLGRSLPGSRLIEEDGFRACLGVHDHPICNFALDLLLDPWVVRKLSRIAAERPSFRIYVLPGDRPTHSQELMVRSGFRETHSLVAMGAGGQEAKLDLPVERVHSVDDRRQIAEFMAAQFFSVHKQDFRKTVAEATFLAEDLELYRVGDQSRPMAAFMLSRSGETLGLYNLCVSARLRRRGLGARLLSWCKNLAFSESRSVVLQCDSGLTPWYCRNEFNSLGTIRVFSLPKVEPTDIITSGSLLSRA
jgi:GNAT superfamily N-acetyltransferase